MCMEMNMRKTLNHFNIKKYIRMTIYSTIFDYLNYYYNFNFFNMKYLYLLYSILYFLFNNFFVKKFIFSYPN